MMFNGTQNPVWLVRSFANQIVSLKTLLSGDFSEEKLFETLFSILLVRVSFDGGAVMNSPLSLLVWVLRRSYCDCFLKACLLSSCRPHGDPQMIRFGAHLVLVLRYLLADEIKDAFKEKIMTVGDFILHM